jgi:hypothetical protein
MIPMNRILILLCSLMIPTAFAQLSFRESLNVRDKTGTPSFIGHHIHGKCGDLDVVGSHVTGTVQGHTISYKLEGGVLTFTVDGARTITGFTDASGRLTQLVDDKGNITIPLTLTPEQAQAAVQRNRANLSKLLDDCAPVITETTKACNPGIINTEAPAPPPGTDAGNGTGEPSTASRKSCLDDEESVDFWNGYFESSGLFDTFNIDQTIACMQAKAACSSICETGFNTEAVVCVIVAGANVVVGSICAIADYGYWLYCSNDCAARYPC